MLYNIRYVHKISQRCGRCGRSQFSHHDLFPGGPNNSEWGHGIAGDDCTGYEAKYEAADLPQDIVERGDLKAVAAMLREARLLSKGDRLDSVRREPIGDDGTVKLVCFAIKSSTWHSLIVGEWPEYPSGHDVVVTRHTGIYRIRWTRNGRCYVTSAVNGGLLASFRDGTWDDKGRLPDHVQTAALESRPRGGGIGHDPNPDLGPRP